MHLTLVIKDNCNVCLRVEKLLENLVRSKEEILLSVVNIKDYDNPTVSIFPALFVNQELYSYGDINEDKLIAYLIEKYQKGACNRAIYKSN